MTSIIDSLVSLSGPLVYIIIGALAFSEAAAFVGLVLPGEAALFLGGVIASQGHVNLGIMLAVAVFAAIAGDSVGYEIGRRFGPGLKNSRAGRFVGADKWAKGEQFLAKRGGTAVLLGRWVGLLRALVPAVAGMARMPYKTFLLYNSIGGTIWAVTVVLLGYFAGQSYKTVEQYLGKASLILTLVLVGALLIALAARFALRNPRWTRTRVAKLAALPPVAAIKAAPDNAPQPTQETTPGSERKARRVPARTKTQLILAVGSIGVAGAYSLMISTGFARPVLAVINDPDRMWFREHQDDEFTVLMHAVTVLGHPLAALIALGVCVGISRPGPVIRARRYAGYLTGTVVLATVTGSIVAALTVPQGEALHQGITLLSPAGQTLISAALLTGAAWLLVRRYSLAWRRTVLTLTALAAITPLIALSHVYLGQQSPIGVTTGWLLGTLFAAAASASWATSSFSPETAPRP
ncbi:undecaprenyl-diphosphatase [Arthrobacter sp. CAN_A6]|uniref:DedA family protein n=1 Tax=Arthrobacter sp. CAN_A6 TaxID=2787721 RepID=UPI0018CB7006